MLKQAALFIAILLCCWQTARSQELEAKVTINHAQIQGTDVSVFDNLQETVEQFINDRQWTALQFQKNERIVCNFNITVTKYDQSNNLFTCTALIQANRPVYNSSYTTTLYNNRDANFDFQFAQFDQLNFNDPQGSQSSSRMRACTCAFLQSGSGSVTQSAPWIKASMVFPRVFPTRLSHEAFPQGCPTCTRGGSRSSA